MGREGEDASTTEGEEKDGKGRGGEEGGGEQRGGIGRRSTVKEEVQVLVLRR